MYAVTAVVLIPSVLLLIFLLLTVFRPEMQEDSFYNKYLLKKYLSEMKSKHMVSYVAIKKR